MLNIEFYYYIRSNIIPIFELVMYYIVLLPGGEQILFRYLDILQMMHP